MFNLPKEGLLLLKSDLILSLALSRLAAMLSGTDILSMLLSPFGTLLLGAIVCLCDETKIGALPPGRAGRFGIGIGLVSSFVSVLTVGVSSVNSLFLFLRLKILCCCLSLSLARNGFGLLSLMGEIFTAGASVGGEIVAVADAPPRVERTEVGEMLVDPATELNPGTWELLNLLWPLFAKRLELAKKPGELLPNVGVGCGALLAGVAMRVGFTLFLVLVATVVLTRLLGLKILLGFLSRPSNGLIIGVKVFPGLVKPLILDLVGLTSF